MQMCPNCDKVYDESEYAKCPRCHPDRKKEQTVIVFDKRDGKAKSVPKSEAHKYN